MGMRNYIFGTVLGAIAGANIYCSAGSLLDAKYHQRAVLEERISDDGFALQKFGLGLVNASVAGMTIAASYNFMNKDKD
jgi:hypothetical protein